MSVDELTFNSDTYYIYHSRCSQNHPPQATYLQHMKRFVELGDIDVLKVIVRNQARLIVFTDNDTEEVLLVLACINDYDPEFTGYQYFKIVA